MSESNETPSDAAVAEALAKELNLETGPEPDPESVQGFFESVKKSSAPPAEEAKPKVVSESTSDRKWVHEPTGKEFETEVDYLRYNSGWTAQQLGEKNKELELKLERLSGQFEQSSQQQPQQAPDPKALKRQIWQKASDDVLNDPASDFILEGLEGTAHILTQQMQAENAKLLARIEQLESSLEETSARTNSGVDAAVEQRILEKHPALKALPPKDRLAMVKELAGAAPAQADSGKLMDRVSQASPADHVEGSALSTPQSSDAALEEEFAKINDPKQELSILGALVRKQGSFLGYDASGF